MPLKSLVAKKSEIAESAIEAIVTPYVRYYVESFEIGFTPEFSNLSNDRKILVYLVAVQGWQYVADDAPAVKTKPADLEKSVGIPGGTLRPTLKTLRERHLIAEKDGAYSVREGNLPSIAGIVGGGSTVSRKASKAKAPKKQEESTAQPEKKKKAKAGKAAGNYIADHLEKWLKSDYFNSPRTVRVVLDRLHEVGAIADAAPVAGSLLRLVQREKLSRKRVDENGKQVWAYCTPKAAK